MRRLLALCLLAAVAFAQSRQTSPEEQEYLEAVLAQAGTNPAEYVRAIEKYLQRYPNSPRRPELERAAVRAAIEAEDASRIILWGERVLAREPDDLQLLERVSHALVSGVSRDAWEHALPYALRWEDLVRRMDRDGPRSGPRSADWRNQVDSAIARALTIQARAVGNLGRTADALLFATRAFDTFPDASAAREMARWLEKQNQPADAARSLADAFTIRDSRSTDADRERDRARMGELYRQAHGSEAGLGDLVLESYDRNLALVHTRELRLRVDDPNAGRTDPMQFVLGGLDGGKLALASLKGKVVVLDFWATWCQPCRAQHPLLERVKQEFRDDPGVVFLSISTDQDRKAVQPFLDEMNWRDQVYFEDGLSRVLKIETIPATVVLDRTGAIAARVGFSPSRFVEQLTTRIREAR